MRNRVVGDGFVLGNEQVRWKFLRAIVFKQNLYLGTNLFADVGKVVDKIEVNPDFQDQEVDQDDYFAFASEGYHVSAGIGLKIGLNENFIVSADYGLATDSRDGKSGFVYHTQLVVLSFVTSDGII
jgi:outer membrane protein assembly factor BamA